MLKILDVFHSEARSIQSSLLGKAHRNRLNHGDLNMITPQTSGVQVGATGVNRSQANPEASLAIHELKIHSGCACKLPANSLPIVCGGLAKYPEDCGVLPFGDQLLLKTVDFGPCVGRDLIVAGRIAALNSLSDIYACGGQPIGADVVLMVDEKWSPHRAAFVQRGIQDACEADGVAITGGHTVVGSETMAGLAVTGIVDAGKFKGKRGAKPGDIMLVSKPVGVGLAVRAFTRGHVCEEVLAKAVEVMTSSNRDASRLAVSAGVSAMTDVTGFGLLGHLGEMVIDTGLGAVISLASVPTVGGIASLPKSSLRTKYLEENLRYVCEQTSLGGIRDFYRLAPLIDPQTSGGLLVSASKDAAAELARSGVFKSIGKFDDQERIEIVD